MTFSRLSLSRAAMEPPNKRQKKVLFAESGSEDEAVAEDFKLNVNKEYARRFEYNKKREEMVQR